MDVKFTVEKLLLDESFLDYCSNKESLHKNRWEQIIVQYPAKGKVIAEAKKLFFLLNPGLSAEEIVAEMNKIREIIIVENEKEPYKSPDHIPVSENLYVDTEGELRGQRVKKLFLYSLIVVSLSVSIIYLVNPGMKKKVLEVTRYQTARAERKKVELPDGSFVILNSNSSISISADYNNKVRKVQLAGDAFFKVIKNAGKPFIVMTPYFSTTALGTSFYIQERNESKNYSVALLEGKVKLSANDEDDKSAYLNSGEEGQWQQVGSGFTKQKFDTSELKQWLSGKISFNKTPVQKAIKQLEKWYGIEIDMQRNNWGKLAITGEYVNVPLDDVLKVICFSLSSHYSYSGNKVVIQ